MEISFTIPSIINTVLQPIKMAFQGATAVILAIILLLPSVLGAGYWIYTADDRLAQRYVDEFIHLGIDLNEPPDPKDKQEMEKYMQGLNLLEEIDILATHMKNATKYSDFVNRFTLSADSKSLAILNTIHGKD